MRFFLVGIILNFWLVDANTIHLLDVKGIYYMNNTVGLMKLGI